MKKILQEPSVIDICDDITNIRMSEKYLPQWKQLLEEFWKGRPTMEEFEKDLQDAFKRQRENFLRLQKEGKLEYEEEQLEQENFERSEFYKQHKNVIPFPRK